MSRFVRSSSYRHVFGNPAKKPETFENVKVSGSAWDTDIISASAKYIAVNAQVAGGGAFQVMPLSRTGRMAELYPLCRGHSAPVLDTAWSPFDDALVASAGDDGNIFLWRIDDQAFEQLDDDSGQGQAALGVETEIQDFTPLQKITSTGRKVGQILWHPAASNLLAGAYGDHTVRLWDVQHSSEPVTTLAGHEENIQSMAFNATGTLLATTCRDRKLRMFDVRAGQQPVAVTEGHGGVKGSRVVWCGTKDRIITTGFSKMSDRQIMLWDSTKLDKASPIKTLRVDSSAGVLMPFWSDNGLLFVAGKGDGNIRYFECDGDELFPLSEYTSSAPQRGMTFLPRRALNTAETEIARAFKVHKNSIEPISFIVPRKETSFQSDLYPPAQAPEPALSCADFFAGKAVNLKYIDLKDGRATAGPSSSGNKSAPGTPSVRRSPVTSPVAASAAAAPKSATAAFQAFNSPKPSASPSSFERSQPLASAYEATPLKDKAEDQGSGNASGSGSRSSPSSASGSAELQQLKAANERLTSELAASRAETTALQAQMSALRAGMSQAASLLSSFQ